MTEMVSQLNEKLIRKKRESMPLWIIPRTILSCFLGGGGILLPQAHEYPFLMFIPLAIIKTIAINGS